MQPFTTDGSLVLSLQTLNGMPAKLRSDLLSYIFPGISDMLGADDVEAPPVDEDEESGVLVDFTDAEFSALLAGCGEKTRKVLATLAKGGDGQFNLNDLATMLGVPAGKLGGVWSGLTRRTRKLKKNPSALFVSWDWDAKTASWEGTLPEVTHAAMRKAFA